MKSQYNQSPVTYQDSEPLNYLENYSGIRQTSVENARKFQAEYQKCRENHSEYPAALDKEGNEGLASLFNTPTFKSE